MKFSEFALFFWIFCIFNLAQPLESRLHKAGDWIITFLVNVHNGLRIINQQKPLHDMSEQHIYRFCFNFNLVSFPTTFRLSSPVSAVLSRPAYILEFVDHPPRQKKKKPPWKIHQFFPLVEPMSAQTIYYFCCNENFDVLAGAGCEWWV